MTGKPPIQPTDPRYIALLKALKLGHFMNNACDYAGISYDAVAKWQRRAKAEEDRVARGEQPNPREQHYVQLVKPIKEARVAAWSRNLQIIQQAADAGTWQAAAWFMERSNKQWARQTQVTGPEGGPVQIAVEREELTDRMLTILETLEEEEREDDNTE
jgi:hypothetical protein